MKQPVLLASNAYVSGAKAASGEAEAVVSGDGSSLALRETDDELWMTVSLPESIRSATGPVISTADLGQPRIVEEYFENPDGSPIVVDRDITGAARGACSARGPLAAYGDGEVLIWSKWRDRGFDCCLCLGLCVALSGAGLPVFGRPAPFRFALVTNMIYG